MFGKIKPLYIYLVAIFLGIVGLFIFNKIHNKTSAEMNAPPIDVNGQAVPNDAIHKGLVNPVAQKPNKNNVMPSIMQHMETLKKAVIDHPRDTLKLREYADFLAEAQMNDKALNYYQKILRINPRRTDVMTSMVYIYFAEKNFKEAERYLNKILFVNRNDVNALYNLGAVSANEGNRVKAKQLWTKIVKEFPNSPLAKEARASLSQL